MMKDTIKYVGLNVSKEKTAVAIADEGREAPRYWGSSRTVLEFIGLYKDEFLTVESRSNILLNFYRIFPVKSKSTVQR
jgi:hypothetical protein